MLRILIEDTTTGELISMHGETLDDRLNDLGAILAPTAKIDTLNYLSQSEINVMIESLIFAADQIEQSGGVKQAFCMYNKRPGELDPEEQLEMCAIARELSDRLYTFISHDESSLIIIE